MTKYVSIALLLITTFASGQDQDPWKIIYSESGWTERDGWQRANELIDFLKISEGSKVADIGCHEGYMSFKLSKIVGERGKVFAVDVDQSKLDKLKGHLSKRNVSNIQPVIGEYDNPKLDTGSLDAVIIIDTYHEMDNHDKRYREMEDRDKILQHIKTALKPGGRILICEPIAETRRGAARSEQERKHELEMDYAVDDLKKAGFKILVTKDRFVDREKEKGDKMWVVVASK
jgi:predicted methyltransferase